MNRAKGLGRGLDALLGGSAAFAPESAATGDRLADLPVAQISPGRYQPRTRMDEASLAELAESIRSRGMMQPILVRPASEGYEIIAGERRWRAARQAGLATVPALVRDVPDDAALALALVENIQRENLNALEEAQGIQRLIDEFGMTHDAAAQAVGRSRAAVSNLLRLLNLAKPVQQMLAAGEIEMGHARALLAAPSARQGALAREVVARRLSVREVERLVQALDKPTRAMARRPADPDVQRLAEELADRLGAAVSIRPGPQGRGRLTIDYASLDQLDGIVAKLRGA